MNYLAITSCSFCFFLFLQKVLFPKLSSKLPAYQQISAANKVEWSVRLASSIHAAQVTLTAIYFIFVEAQSVNTNLLWVDSSIARFNIAWTCGFMLSDLLLMCIYYEKIGGTPVFFGHHIISIIGYMICLSNGYLIYHANFRIISEMSTTFVNIRWILAVSKMKYTRRYFYNGLIMTATFFLSRIFLIPFFWKSALPMINSDIYAESVDRSIHYLWIGLCIVLDCINVMWMNRMLRGIFSFLLTKKEAAE